ncbi:MAG: hypothetical protein HY049_12565 [Acidobacteria bacterium]|nr:hypothetical protein [Acidobacteriota bacterium]
MPDSPTYVSPVPWEEIRPDTAIIMCVDGRWRPHVQEFATSRLGAEAHYDIVAVPGGIEPLTLIDLVPKDFNFLRRRLETLVESHGTRRIVAVAHQDCGWYKAKLFPWRRQDPVDRQLADLRRAARWLRETFPGITVETWFARRSPEANPGVIFDAVS